jgi:invasion protein IalB
MRFLMSFSAIPAMAIFSAAVLALSSPAVAASIKTGDTSGDWTYVCPEVNGKTTTCQLVQTQLMENKEDGKKGRLLQLTLSLQPDKSVLMHALLPLGISIPTGVAYNIDNGEQSPLMLQRCTGVGCEAIAIIPADKVTQLKKGNEMKVGFRAGTQTLIIPVSLKGVTDGLGKLK